MSLPRRRLGASGPEITTVGFGCWALGGNRWAYGWGSQDDDRSIRAIHHGVERGINWVDTAACYGEGHSEEVVGRAVRALPESDRPLVFTKSCVTRGDRCPDCRLAIPSTLREALEESLGRLGLDHVDLFQIHWPPSGSRAIEDAWEEMLALRSEGKALAVGVSNFDPALLDRCDRLGHVDSLQPSFSLLDREMAASELVWALGHQTGVICYSPMASGILTDSFGPERVAAMGEDDWRKHVDAFNAPELGRNLSLRDALRPIAQRHGTTVAAVAVSWVTNWPGVTGAIVGARSPEQVDGSIGAATLQLAEDDVREIAAAIAKTGAGAGPSRPSERPA